MSKNLTIEVMLAISHALEGKTNDFNTILSEAVSGCATFLVKAFTLNGEEDPELAAASVFRDAADQLETEGGEE